MKVEGCSVSRKIHFIVFLAILLSFGSFHEINAQESKNAFPPIDSDESIVVKTNLISFNVSVTDADGIAVSGLSKENFSLFDNKTPQEIHFFSSEDAPASISIILDTSGSMSGKKIEQAKKALEVFMQTSKPEDEFFLIDVNSKANLLLSRTRDGESLLQKFKFVEPKGNTALYDAINLGIEKADGGSYARKIVLIISDGEDTNSRISFRKLKNSLKESNAVVYAVGIESYFSYFGKGPSGLDILQELAEESGGKAYFPKNPVEMNEVFEKIALDIRRLYSIGYYPSEPSADGKNHRITVKVKPLNESFRLIVHSRKEYKSEISSTKR